MCFALYLAQNHGQLCAAGTRLFVQEGIYDKFMKLFLEKTAALKVGDPFNPETFQGPQISKTQYNVSPAHLARL